MKHGSTVKPIQREAIQGQHSGQNVYDEMHRENRAKHKCDPHSNSYSPVHCYTKSDDDYDFEDPNLILSQNKSKSPPLVKVKVLLHQEKKDRADVANVHSIKTKIKVKKLENRKSKMGVHVDIPIQLRNIEIVCLHEEYEIRNGVIGPGELQDPYIPQDDNVENVNLVNGSIEDNQLSGVKVVVFQKLHALNRKQILKDVATRIHDRLTEFG
ncbi:unnamed protein product [Lactuca saligna]|uniref:Uncharacterized protein n=1 Tax=Lactuca saligna TaxID=75948 RepID=A0AA36EHI7_LACSI|nr:unnamed protein product [Lactuca saligna]